MRVLTEMAQAAEVVLLHENEKEIFGDVPGRVLDIVQSVNLPSLKLAWDAANSVQVGVTPFTQAYPTLRPHTAYIQIKDAVMGSGEVVPPAKVTARSGKPSKPLPQMVSTGSSPWSRTWVRRTSSAGSPARTTSSAPPKHLPASSSTKESTTHEQP